MKPLKFTHDCRGRRCVKLEVSETGPAPGEYKGLRFGVWEGREKYPKHLYLTFIEALALSEFLRAWLQDQVSEVDELKKAHKELLDRAHVYGVWGPWSEGWEGSYDQKHWGEE